MYYDPYGDHECTQVQPVRPSRAPAALRPTLIVVAGNGSAGKAITLGGTLVVGRHTSADLPLDECGISRRHASFTVDASGTVRVVDLESTNGTYVNGERVESHVLRDGDKIELGGSSVLKFSYQDAHDAALQQSLYDSATRDSLTRLYNRRHFDDVVPREISFARRHRRPLSIVLFDVDHFKSVNDRFGHQAGDEVLGKLAECVLATARVEDVVARIGGEEFAIVLRDLTIDAALECAERIRHVVASTVFMFEGQRIPVTISIGLAALDDSHATPAELIALADQSLYAAKRRGRNCVVTARHAA